MIQETGEKMGTADKTYYLDDDGKVTTDEEKAAVVLINKGQEIPKEMADQYGIGKGKSAKAASETDSDESADEGEKASGPKSNKAASPKKDKQS